MTTCLWGVSFDLDQACRAQQRASADIYFIVPAGNMLACWIGMRLCFLLCQILKYLHRQTSWEEKSVKTEFQRRVNTYTVVLGVKCITFLLRGHSDIFKRNILPVTIKLILTLPHCWNQDLEHCSVQRSVTIKIYIYIWRYMSFLQLF